MQGKALYILTTTLPDEEQARALARRLVEEGLAACAQADAAMTSYYIWDGALQEDREVRLVLKVPAARLEALIKRLKALHPYETPQILWWQAQGDADYVRWAEEMTQGGER